MIISKVNSRFLSYVKNVNMVNLFLLIYFNSKFVKHKFVGKNIKVRNSYHIDDPPSYQ